MPLELAYSLIGLTFLGILAVAAGILVQTRRDGRNLSSHRRRTQ
jgi:hypothetical protein